MGINKYGRFARVTSPFSRRRTVGGNYWKTSRTFEVFEFFELSRFWLVVTRPRSIQVLRKQAEELCEFNHYLFVWFKTIRFIWSWIKNSIRSKFNRIRNFLKNIWLLLFFLIKKIVLHYCILIYCVFKLRFNSCSTRNIFVFCEQWFITALEFKITIQYWSVPR